MPEDEEGLAHLSEILVFEQPLGGKRPPCCDQLPHAGAGTLARISEPRTR